MQTSTTEICLEGKPEEILALLSAQRDGGPSSEQERGRTRADTHSQSERTNHMKRLILGVAVAAALVLPTTALAAGGLTGKYSAKITHVSTQLNGTWTLDFMSGGKYTVSDNGMVVIHGKFTSTGSKITFSHETGPAACPATGKYTYKRSGTKLTFTRVSDSSCAGRSAVLGQVYKKIG